MKKGMVAFGLIGSLLLVSTVPSVAQQAPRTNTITGKSVLASVTSLLVWPGIGQAINSNPGDKVATHAVLGLLPPYRFWSAWDAIVRREGGYWKGRI